MTTQTHATPVSLTAELNSHLGFTAAAETRYISAAELAFHAERARVLRGAAARDFFSSLGARLAAAFHVAPQDRSVPLVTVK